jgi:Domain of unknown function (DUF4091)
VIQRSLNRVIILNALAACLSLPGTANAQSGPIVWVVPSLQRIGPSNPAGSGTQAQLAAGKGEYESFQIVVRGPSGGLSNVNVSVTNLTNTSGGVISNANMALFREQYVYVNSSSPNWGGSNQPLGPGWYPDGLIPFVDPNTGLPPVGGSITAAPFSVGASMNQPVWVDVFVPRTAAAGPYTGTFTVTSSQGSVTGQISLQVWNFTLPLQPTLKSSFSYWTADSLLAEQELLRNKVTPLNVPAANELSLISNYGLGTNNIPYWSGADVSSCTMSAAPSVTQFKSAAAANTSGLYLFDYSADEVGSCTNLYTTIQQWAYNMHQAGINNLITMAPVSALFSDGSGTGRSAVDDWVVLPVTYNSSVSMVNQALQKGDSVWSYNTLVQDAYSPKWEIDFAPINFRIQPGFINQSLGLSGLLYWRVDDWNSSPWTNVNNAGTFSSANYPGEAVLVYPGSTVGITGVAPSMRLKWIRDGVEDYEYIALLKRAGKGSWALQVAQTVGPDWTNWTRDPNALASARQQLGQELDILGGGSGTAPSAPANPAPTTGSTNVSTTPPLSWSASTNATSYDVYLGTSSSPSLVTNTTGTTYQSAALANSTTYYWKVTAKNSSGSTSSSVWSFTTNPPALLPPSAPGNPSPAAGSTGVSTSPTLSWSTSTNAASYDVYFGSSASPSLVASVSGTSYKPASLNAGSTYYWKIVAKNASGSTSSSIWSFTTAASAPPPPPPPSGPASVSVSPSSGTALYHVFSFVYSDSAGYQSLSGVHALFNTSVSGTDACWFYYDTAGKMLWLASNDTSAWYSLPLGSASKVQNGQCEILGGGFSVTGSGNNLTLNIPIVFATSFAGAKSIYMNATATGGTSSSMVSLGTWTVPASTTLGAVAVSPASGNTASQVFTAVFSDPNGYQSLSGIHMLVNSSVTGTNACWIYYDAVGKVIWLASDNVASWSNTAAGSTTTVQNSQCQITGSGVSATGSGTNLTLNVPITFKTAFAGTRNIYMSASDKGGSASNYAQTGAWNVP